MKRFILGLVFCLWGSLAVAQSNIIGGGVYGDVKVSAGGGCSQATTFLARTSGLSGTETTAYTNLICGLVTDGIYSSLDALYIFATNTTTTANLNLISTSFGITVNGSPTFTADRGYTGDGTAAYLDTGFVPFTAGGNYTQNLASFGVCVLNANTSGSFNYVDMAAAASGGTLAQLVPFAVASLTNFAINENLANNVTVASSSQGTWMVVRPNSTNELLYLNGSLVSTGTNTSGGVPRGSFTILGEPGTSQFSIDQVGASFIGGLLSSTQVTNFKSRLSTYITAVGGSGC